MSDSILASLTFGYAFVAVLHICGLTMLCWVRFSPVNQRTILIHLAISELGNALTLTIIYLFLQFKGCNHNCYLTEIFFATLFTVTNKMLIIYLICDRMLEVHLNIKYPLYFTENKVKKMIMGLWIVTAGYSLTIVLFVKFDVSTDKSRLAVMTSVVVVEDVIIVLTAVITYVILYRKVKNVIARSKVQTQVQNNDTDTRSKFLLPSLIVASYMLLNLAGDVMFLCSITLARKVTSLNSVCRLFWILGWIADGILYIFFQKSIRKRLIALCRRQSSRVSLSNS